MMNWPFHRLSQSMISATKCAIKFNIEKRLVAGLRFAAATGQSFANSVVDLA
jgi:hypothetical protein